MLRCSTNRTTAAQPAPPKQFTDEELKLQYGIHLATRLQSDETGKESKWADIDDEEDDWAPETLEWMDGTKSAVKDQPVIVQPVKMLLKKEEQSPSASQIRPILTALKRPSQQTGAPKTILRPGAAQQAKQEGSTAANATDSTLSSSSRAATPATVKSPWAPLPPMDKPLPVFNPPPAQVNPFTEHRAMQNYEALPPQIAAREIEADTFDRSWRENERGGRELFNSQSGRYEPAPENRRSSRQDHGSRQPALLQRPSHDGGSGPGPSAAFQTRSNGQDGPTWGRRRGSSISGTGSIPFERRGSVSKLPEATSPIVETKTGIVIGHDIGPQPPKSQDPAPNAEQVQQDRPSELAAQKKIMQEKREAAIRRREEQQAKEEAEKQERIRLRLAALGPATSEAKSEAAKADASGAVTEAAKAEIVAPQTPPETLRKTQPQAAVPTSVQLEPATTDQKDQAISQVQPKIPSPAQAQPLQSVRSDPGVAKPQIGRSPVPTPTSPVLPSVQQKEMSTVTPRSQQSGALQSVPPSSYSSPGEQKAQAPWKSPSLDPGSFATWGASGIPGHTGSGSNVWGPPSASRHIGNGTFDSSLSRLRPHQAGIRPVSSSFPRQSSMGRGAQQLLGTQEASELSPSLLSEPQLPGLNDGRTNERFNLPRLAASSTDMQARPYKPAPIGPPPRPNVSTLPPSPSAQRGVAAWGQFAAQAEEEQNRPLPASEARSSPAARSNGQQWKETFKQTKMSDNWQGGPREVIGLEKAVHGARPQALPSVISPTPPVSQTQPAATPSLAIAAAQQESTVRLPSASQSVYQPAAAARTSIAPGSLAANVAPQQSRFFPATLSGGSPPPEEADHPVHYGSARKPLVNLPHPKPQVKLPPSAQAHSRPVDMSQRVPSMRRVNSQAIVDNSDWQARFNGLFGRVETTAAAPPSPPKTPPKMQVPALAVMSETRADLYIDPQQLITTVSLPLRSQSLAQVDVEEEITTKPTVDEIFNEELSFGSIPAVSLPRGAIYPVDIAPSRSQMPNRPHYKFTKAIETQSKQELLFYSDDFRRPTVVTVSIALSKRPAKDVPLALRSKASYQSRKPANKISKSERAGSSVKEGMPSPAHSIPSTPQAKASPKPKAGSRQVSMQKTQSPAASAALSNVRGDASLTGEHVAKPRAKSGKWPKSRQASTRGPATAGPVAAAAPSS